MTKRKGQKDKQHNGQKKKNRRTSNTMTKRGHCVAFPSVLLFWSLCCLSFCPFPLVIVLLVLLSPFFGHCVACPSEDKQHHGQKKRTEGQATQWSKEKEQKNKQHNDQKNMTEGQATQSPKENDRRIVLLVLLSVFFLAIVMLVLLSLFFGHCVACPSVIFFGHCVACPSVLFFWPFCCLSFCHFLLVIVLLVLLSYS
jgi:cation transport ATPase